MYNQSIKDLQELVSMESLKIMRKTASPIKNSLINASKNPGTFYHLYRICPNKEKRLLSVNPGQTSVDLAGDHLP